MGVTNFEIFLFLSDQFKNRMKKVIVMAGQNDEDYGQRLTHVKVREVLRSRNIESVYPKFSIHTMTIIPFYDGLIVSGKLNRYIDNSAIIDLALEFGKEVFLFGLNLEESDRRMVKHLTTQIMSPLVKGFVTDAVGQRWASLWAGSRIKAGVDIANVYLLERSEYERGKFVVIAPSKDGILSKCTEEKWFPMMDARVIVEDPQDSKTAVQFASKLKVDDVSLIFKINDIMDAIKNARFVISEKFYTTLTAISFETPFVHVGKKILRYIGKDFSNYVCDPDMTELGLAFSRLNEFDFDAIKNFNSRVRSVYNDMERELDAFTGKNS
ncbi:hypothetical protein ATHSA_0465 [Athalassotoga saccharophila]|nr:hypothetical protein ATHSA_0465 [Athalassotoga saccharophila]